MIVSGRIVKVLGVKTGIGKTGPWKRKEFVIEQNNKYNTKLCPCIWDNALFNYQLTPGEEVNLEMELRSNTYKNKWFTQAVVLKFIAEEKKPVRAILQCHLNEYDDDIVEYTREDYDDMYKAAFEDDAQWLWNID